MKVTLINYTSEAAALLVFTKEARLGLSPARLDEIRTLHPDEMAKRLAYIANTIPSSWEFVDYVFLVEGVSRAYTHQQVRTRTGSYAQQSLRVVDLSDTAQIEYVFTKRNRESPAATAIISGVRAHIMNAYRDLLKLGQPVEDARGILPTNIATNIVCKFNLRTMVELVRSREGGRTQDEFQQVVRAMADEVLRVHPWAAQFMHPKGRDYFAEIEAFAEREYGGDLVRKGELLKIVDKMRKEQ